MSFHPDSEKMPAPHSCCESNAPDETYIDPVCGMTVTPETASGHTNYLEMTYYFCARHCLEKFQQDPEEYVSSRQPATMEPQAGVQYTCPMHPEILQDQWGSCPLCGMALESLLIYPADETENIELNDMMRRLWISAMLTLPVFILAMGEMLPGRPVVHLLSMKTMQIIEFIMVTPIMFWAGSFIFNRAWKSIVHKSPNMFTLIALGIGVSYGYSSIITFLPKVFQGSLQAAHGEMHIYFEASAFITTLVILGQVLELRARSQTGNAIKALLNLTPETARKLTEDGNEQEVSVSKIGVSDRLRIRPGEKIPVDGVLLEGSSAVEESMITGEAFPIEKLPGSLLIGGTVNTTGSFLMQAQRIGRDTMLSQIIQRVSEAQRSKAPVQRLVDRFAGGFVPIVLGISMLSFLLWMFWGPEPRLTHALVNAVAVLIIACPCALGLATPMSVMAGMGRGAKSGILIKSAETLEVFEKVDLLIMDKTGTLTEGKPQFQSLISFNGMPENDLLWLIASLEHQSEHPLASAILAEAARKNISLTEVQQFQSFPGQGISGTINHKIIALGNLKLMETLGIPSDATLETQAENLRSEGQTIMFIAVDRRVEGLVTVTDPIKANASRTIGELKRLGITPVMVTGDHMQTARAVAEKLGIAQFEAGVLPAGKSDIVKHYQALGHVVAMVGDGVNDAPALAQAQVGIAMGTGADVAMETADITLLKGDLNRIIGARELSRATMQNIRQNLFFAFFYNVSGVPIAAGILYPVSGILLSPVIAAVAMSLSSVCVIFNALRLQRIKL